jgi:hypothetical protein
MLNIIIFAHSAIF